MATQRKTGDAPILKIGVVSDIQGYDYEGDWGMHNLSRAFELLAPKGIDVLVNAGDIGDHGDDDSPIRFYMSLFKRHFAGREPVQVACLGNHDYWYHSDERTYDDCLRDFMAAMGNPPEQVIHKIIGGYDFIALSSDNARDYCEADCALLAPHLKAASERDPSKPIFVITHHHPKDTVGSSWNNNDGRQALRDLLNGYPQVISLSGHTHAPLHDERCIWQGEFTAIDTSGLSYGCTHERCENTCGPIIPYAREALYCMYMEVFADRVEIHRYHVEDQKEIKPDRLWTVPVPYSIDLATYTPERALSRTAPEFAPGTEVLFRYDFGYVYFIFEQASHEDFVHFYRLAITELDAVGAPVKTRSYRYYGNFHRLERNRDSRMVLKAPAFSMEAGKRYLCEIFPVETFGREGKPISIDVTVRPTYAFRNVDDKAPQE